MVIPTVRHRNVQPLIWTSLLPAHNTSLLNNLKYKYRAHFIFMKKMLPVSTWVSVIWFSILLIAKSVIIVSFAYIPIYPSSIILHLYSHCKDRTSELRFCENIFLLHPATTYSSCFQNHASSLLIICKIILAFGKGQVLKYKVKVELYIR